MFLGSKGAVKLNFLLWVEPEHYDSPHQSASWQVNAQRIGSVLGRPETGRVGFRIGLLAVGLGVDEVFYNHVAKMTLL